MKEQLIKAFNFHQQNYTITNDGKFEIDSSNTIDLTFGNLDSDGFKVLISVFTIDNSLSRIIISDHSNYVETRDQEILNHFLNQTGYFMDYLHESQNKLEDLFEKSYKATKRKPS